MSSPLNANSLSSLLQNQGFRINPVAAQYMGSSVDNGTYSPGLSVTSTCLEKLTQAINIAYTNIGVASNQVSEATYNNLITIGAGVIPALGNSKPPTYIVSDPSNSWTGQATTGYAISGNTDQGQSATWLPYVYDLNTLSPTYQPNSSITRYGYLRLHALQAQNEFNFNNDSPSGSVAYQDFTGSFMAVEGFVTNMNPTINTMTNGKTFLDGVYSNMNDLISGDLTGVNLATKAFGQDCITLGKVIDLKHIQKFGLPSTLLQTIKKYNGFTQSLSLALLASGLTSRDVESIANGGPASPHQEQQIYGAFLIIMGQDLVDILVPLNCKTLGLDTLADLLNIKKMFPNSYFSMTVPLYNLVSASTNSKTYYLIYEGNGVSSKIDTPAVKEQIGTITIPGEPHKNAFTPADKIQEPPKGFASYLYNILPYDIALAAGAFNYSMRQIKKIKHVDFEKFAQVTYSTETTKDLNLVNGTTVPADTTLMTQAGNILGAGSGPNGTYTMSDFFGCMSGLPYNWKKLTNLILALQTDTLVTIYSDLYDAVVAADPGLSATLQGYIDAANIEIAAILANNPEEANGLNTLYNQFGTQLLIEQRSRYIAIPPVPVPRDTRLNPYPQTIVTFTGCLKQYSSNTFPHMEAQTIEAISDLSTVGGQSVVGSMREHRNEERLQKIGVPLDNNIPGSLDGDSEMELLCNGAVPVTSGALQTTTPSTEIQEINGAEVAPVPDGVLLMPGSPLPNQVNPYLLPAGDNTLIKQVPTIQKIQAPVYVVNGVPLDVGQAKYPSSFAGSPASNLLPINLNTTYASGTMLPATLSVPEAIDQVIHCNCDCWLG